MKISKRGLEELIKPFEGYKSRQPDGSCKAYRCPAGVWTCGWGCTEGVNQHTAWTADEATEALSREMSEHEKNVEALVTVPLNQGQFDAMVSLCYNVGVGNLKDSTLLCHLNNGDYSRAASHFSDWKYSRVGDEKLAMAMKVKVGTKVVLPGLVRRRAAEAAMFLETADDQMVQKVLPPRKKLDARGVTKAATTALVAGGAAVKAIETPIIPTIPNGVTETLTNLASWGKLLPSGDAKIFAVGALVFAGVAGATLLIGKLRA